MHGGRRLFLRRIDHAVARMGKRVSKNLIGKLLILGVIIGLLVAFRALDLGQYFTLTYLKASADRFGALYDEHRALVILVYFAVYVVAASLSLPGAVVLTLAGGALFGLLTGTLIVSFASSIGATLACFVARFFLRDWVQGKFGEKIAKVNEGIEREGAFYLFTLRLIPVFPFWMINLAMGLTKMPLRRFYWVSQLGMLAGTIVYVNAGRELAKIDSLKGILSPSLLISFVLIGIFPIAVKKLVTLYRTRRTGGNT